MRSLPIRLRLTLWNFFLFGTIIAVVITIVYFSHKQSIYKDVDLILSNISSHVYEEITRQLNEGEPLDSVNVSFDTWAVTDISVRIRNEQGELIQTVGDPFFNEDSLLSDHTGLGESSDQTITDENGKRVRIKTIPIYQDETNIGSIETLYSLNVLDRSLRRFKWIVIGLAALGIAIASLVGWYLAKKTLRRVDLIGKTAQAIAMSQDFEQRVLYIGPPDELGQLTETFNQMLDSLEKAYKNQKRFLSDASHELRAPLTTIRGNLDILYKMNHIPEIEKQEILDDIREEAIRMSKLVSDLLSLARADAGQTPHKEVIDLSSIAIGVLEEIRLWERGIDVITEIKDQIKILGDRNLIKQILIILLDNAMKYTPADGKIFVKLEAKEKQAVIQIEDTGIGIHPDEVQFIFDRFYRSDEARRISPDGTGLGLSIAKWIAEEHQGLITLKSIPGKGTVFTVGIPLAVEPKVLRFF